MLLEQVITRGHPAYIQAIGYDAHRAQLCITIQTDPQDEACGRVVLFSALQQFTDMWDTDGVVGPRDLDTLIGLDEYPEAPGTRYCIRTSFREIHFYTEVRPIIIGSNEK